MTYRMDFNNIFINSLSISWNIFYHILLPNQLLTTATSIPTLYLVGYICLPCRVINISKVTPLKKIDSASSTSSQTPASLYVSVRRLCAPSTVVSVWLALVQILCILSQSPWIYMCICSGKSRNIISLK